MANFKVKNNFKAESVKLVDATAYQVENGNWYMELQYEYEDKSGVHRRYHREVCIHKLDYLNILKAVENARVAAVKDEATGGFSSTKVIDYDFISGISVGCRYYQHRTDTCRDGDSQCLTF